MKPQPVRGIIGVYIPIGPHYSGRQVPRGFVFNPGGRGRSSKYKFPREQPNQGDWNQWFDFWHSFATTGDKLKLPLESWTNPTHCIWKRYYREDTKDLQRVKGNTMFLY